MKRLIPITLFTFLSLFFSPVANAELKVAQCFELKYPSSSLSSNILTLSADVYALCDETELGRGNGQKPVYSLIEQSDLNLTGCPGPKITQMVGNRRLGKVICTIRVGDGVFASSRIGASQTTIKAWLAWDFSSKTVVVNHVPIPGPTKVAPASPKTPVPSVSTPTQAPFTPTATVESQETANALKETQEAIEKADFANLQALAVEKSATDAISKMSPLITTITNLLTEMRARLESSIEMLQRKSGKS
jgi:hypothetical protein